MVSHHVVASAAASSSPTRRGASKRKLRISARPAMAAHTDSASSEDIENGTSGSDIAAAAAHQQEGAATPRPSSQQQLPSTHDAVSAANDRFLDEVEGELLSDSSGQTLLNGNSSNKARHHHQQQQQQTHYPSLLSNTKPSLPPSQYPYEEDIKAFPPHAYNPYYNQDVGTSSTTNMSIETNCGGDPSAFRRKMGIGIVYILVGTIYELIIYKLAQRTVWPNATLFVPLELSALTVAITILSLVLRRKKSGGNNAQLQHIFGLHSSTSLSTGWKEILPLAASVGAAATLRILKDSFLEPSISTSVSVSICCHTRRRDLSDRSSIRQLFQAQPHPNIPFLQSCPQTINYRHLLHLPYFLYCLRYFKQAKHLEMASLFWQPWPFQQCTALLWQICKSFQVALLQHLVLSW